MRTGLSKVVEQLEETAGGLSDAQLLARFVGARDEPAFTALLRRHGPMVLGVCRRVLRNYHDAEDAFQATFLILARRAGSVARRESVACYLYTVAYRAALEAAAAIARRRVRERRVEPMPHQPVEPHETPDWKPLLDRELDRLTQRYREAVVLCDLEGRTRKEVGRMLGVPESTVSSRLARGRSLLAKRLAARGVVLTSAVLAIGLATETASANVPAALVGRTVQIATIVSAGRSLAASTAAVVLMKGVMKAMLMKKLRLVVGAAMLTAAIGAIGFASRSGTEAWAQSPAQPKGADTEPLLRERGRAVVADDALRREVEDLRATVRVLLRENHSLQQELETIRGGGAGPAGKGVADTVPDKGRVPESDPSRPNKYNRIVPDGRSKDQFRRGDDLGRPKQDDNISPPEGEFRRGDILAQPQHADLLRNYRDAKGDILGQRVATQDVEAALKSLREGKDQEGLRLLEDALQKLRGESRGDAAKP
jgi:RNA polymerase sigma factor (sigma-70 family)